MSVVQQRPDPASGTDVGVVEWIHTAPGYGAPVVARERVRGTPGAGLDGDRYATEEDGSPSPSGRLRGDITLIEAEAIERTEVALGVTIAPGEMRRNVTTRGIRLNDLVGRRFRVGQVTCQGLELSEPCTYLEGLIRKPVVKPMVHQAGLRAAIIAGGDITIGDEVVPEPR